MDAHPDDHPADTETLERWLAELDRVQDREAKLGDWWWFLMTSAAVSFPSVTRDGARDQVHAKLGEWTWRRKLLQHLLWPGLWPGHPSRATAAARARPTLRPDLCSVCQWLAWHADDLDQ